MNEKEEFNKKEIEAVKMAKIEKEKALQEYKLNEEKSKIEEKKRGIYHE